MASPPRPDQALQDHPFAASTRHPLPVLEWRWCSTRHERCQDRHPVQKQRRQKRLQQLQRHLPLEYHGQTVCHSLVVASSTAGGTHLPRVPMGLSSRTFYSAHHLLLSPTKGEVQGTAEAPLHCLHRSDQGLQPGELERALQHPSEDRMTPAASQHDQIFSWRYEGNHSIRGQHVRTFWHQKRREARLRPYSNPLQHPLLPPSETCFWEL